MEFGFFLGNIQEIGEHAELGFDRNGAKRAKQRRNILGGVFRLHIGGEVFRIALLLMEVLGIAAMSQIDLASACVHDWVPPAGQ